MCTDRRTDMTKLIVAFRNFSNAPKNPMSISPPPPPKQGGTSTEWSQFCLRTDTSVILHVDLYNCENTLLGLEAALHLLRYDYRFQQATGGTKAAKLNYQTVRLPCTV